MVYRVQTSVLPQYCPITQTEPNPLPYEVELRAKDPRFFGLSFVIGRVPDTAFPRTAKDRKGLKTLPDFFGAGPWPVVSERFRDILEAHEPGVHQYSPELEVSYKDGRPSEYKYYCINILNNMRGFIVPERSTWHRSPTAAARGQVPIESRAPEKTLFIEKSKVDGLHLWRGEDYYREWFMSDELVAAVRSAKLKQLNYFEQLA